MNPRPRLRDDLVFVAQEYRGQETYIVKDPVTHKYFRFKPLEVFIMQHFTGEYTPGQLAAALAAEGIALGEGRLTKFAAKLSSMGLFQRTLQEQSTLQLERLRAERHRRVKGTHYEGSLLRMRWSVGDPDQLFDRWLPRLRFFFSPAFMAISVALFAVYFLVLAQRWDQVTGGILAMYTAEFYTLNNLVLFWATAMVVVAIHELGHGFTCKYFGGHVHEMGAMLIYFQPAFYCNVNDAWTFPKLSDRLWVTAAGSWIQLVVAAVAAIVWVVVDPGTVISRVAFFAVLIGGATTILANANPLIPLDGYYALSDYLEVPNLRQRALGYLAWWVKRHVILQQVPEPPVDDRERRIFVVYGALAFLYITTILTVVALFVLGFASRTLGLLGVIAGLLAIWAMLRGAIREWGRAVVTSVREHRTVLRRVVGPAGLGLLAVVLLSIVIPWPITVRGEFVAAPLLEVPLAAPDDAVLTRVSADEGTEVTAGTPVAILRNFGLERRATRLQRAADSLSMAALVARASGDAAAIRRASLAQAAVREQLQAARERVERLALRAPASGIVLTRRLADSVGREFEVGDIVAVLAVGDSLELRVRLDGAGATAVAPGHPASLLVKVGTGRALTGAVTSVSRAAGGEHVEARIRIARTRGVPLGVTGEAKIRIRRSSVFGALWWSVRKRFRNDLFL